MKQARVLLIFSSSELGGAERSLTRMALAANGQVRYTLATLDGCGPWVDWCHQLGAAPVVLGNRDGGGGHGRYGLKAIINLLSLVRRDRFDALYVIGLRASLWVRFLRPLMGGVRLVHGIRWNPNSVSRLDRALRVAEFLLSYFIDSYICNSQIAAKTLVQRAAIRQDKIQVIYNGLDQLPPPADGFATRSPNVVILANLNPRKGHREFLNVIQAVCQQVPQAHFFFVGRDDMNGQLATAVSEHNLNHAVTLVGYQADVDSWLSQSQLMVLPSRWGEGCPTSILEGFAHSLPVIAYAIDGIPELIDDGVDGALIPPGDTKAMTAAIVQCLLNPSQSEQMGKRGRAKVAQFFTLAHCAKQHDSVFKTLTSRN
ncbi:MAG: glycosyltransferase family 4 protein [Holosporaceae bacterium]|jgi:glycosyltransferase involved in cell wall biosynthesis